jgi:hypothetical protein
MLFNLNQQAAELVPEPATFVLAVLGLLSLGCFVVREKLCWR